MRRHRTLLSIIGLVVVSAMLPGCDASSADPGSEAPLAGDQVQVVDNDFEPSNLEVAAGDTVTWEWEGNRAHDVVGDDFQSEVQPEGSFEHTFDRPGTYDYECTLHSGMTGRVTVTEG